MGLPLLAEPHDPMEGGLVMRSWLTLWLASHAVTSMGTWRLSWPDGGATLAQPALLVAMFDLIEGMVAEASKQNG